MTDHFRGHPTRLDDNGEWVFSDTGKPTVDTWRDRPCGHCGEHNTAEGHDGCLGTLPGVINACCGHGEAAGAYVQFEDGTELREGAAVAYFELMAKRVAI